MIVKLMLIDSTMCPKPWQWVQPRSSISLSTGSDKSISWTLQKYWACKEQHESCIIDEHPLLPTRVIDLEPVGQYDDPDSADVRLHEKVGNQYAPFVCLSHCWGEESSQFPIRTTRSNLHERKERIAFASLSKTFQDAVVFTRKLQFRYLWVDSLCIIQDDLRDWTTESTRMEEVYSTASLTLAATCASSSADGFLRTPSAIEQGYAVRGFPDASLEDWTIHFRKRTTHSKLFVTESNERYPLLARGWVLQERLLSTRVLHFTDSELIWKCAAAMTCQCSTLTGAKDPAGGYGSLDPKLAKASLTVGKDDQVHERWRNLIEEYTRLKLTNRQDRLSAVEGLSRAFSQRKLGYLAGIWRDSFLEDICWKAAHFTNGLYFARQETSSAPSWSWASTDAPVSFYTMGTLKVTPICTLRDAKCMKIVHGSARNTIEGYLDFEGHIFDVSVSVDRGGAWATLESGEQATSMLFSADHDLSNSNGQTISEGTFAFPLGTYSQQAEYILLILEQVEDQANTYRRIGLCILNRYRTFAGSISYGSKAYPVLESLLKGSKMQSIRII